MQIEQKDSSLLNLLITSQITKPPFLDAKKIAETKFITVPRLNLSQFFPANCLSIIPHFVDDPEFSPLFKSKLGSSDHTLLQQASQLKAAAIFSPNSNSTVNKILNENQDYLFIRTGFFCKEDDIYESVSLGFRNFVFHTEQLDRFTAQYYTEICRDLNVNIIYIAKDEKSLSLILETDAPYILLWPHCKNTFKCDWSRFVTLLSRIPKSCVSFALFPGATEIQEEEMKRMGIRGIIK